MISKPPPQGFNSKVLDVLRDPSALPAEFATWVRGQITRNPQVQISDSQLPTAEKRHQVGAAGEPAFQNSWTNYDPVNWDTCCFFKDLSGIVHLQGLVMGGTSGIIFTLPSGYRPPKNVLFVVDSNNAFARVDIAPSGTVTAFPGYSSIFLSLSGITFRP